jgi:hypothetical protein
MNEQNPDDGAVYSMIQECVDSYRFDRQADGGVIVTIHVAQRFADLWAKKLNELRTTESEIRDHEPNSP